MHLSRTILAAAIAVVLSAPSAQAAPAEQHCVVSVVDQRADGELVLGPSTCYRSEAGARRAVGLPEDATGAELDGSAQLAATGTIGVHYDGANYTGSSITITGTGCTGGYVNLDKTWRNRISSTANGCPRVRHFNFVNLSGASEDTTGYGNNLFFLNNGADSIQYLAG